MCMEMDFRKVGLVLEGGGMRGVFTCGVLDYMMDHGVEFPYAVGVSAGACNGLSYMSRQRGRMVTTDCVTGRACYLEEKHDGKRLLDIAKASSSLPYVCPITYVDGRPMLDGGIVDSIPVMRAVEQGYGFNVVVLTRNRGFRKTEKDIRVPSFIYRRYPCLRQALSRRCETYNAQLELVERMEDEGRILAVRPVRKVTVNRIERDINKLTALYDEGYACARQVLQNFLPE